MHKQLLLVATLMVAGTRVSYAAVDSPWNGTWKLNDAKSQRTGSVDVVSIDGSGKFTVKSSGLTFSFGCDGAEYPVPGGRTLTCTKVSESDLHFVSRVKGSEVGQTERTLSDGGKRMTVVVTGKAPDGTPFHDTETYKKLDGGTGWEGSWQNTTVQTSSHGVAVVEATADSITFTYPMIKSTLTARLDGTPATEQGPRAAEGLTISLTADGPNAIP